MSYFQSFMSHYNELYYYVVTYFICYLFKIRFRLKLSIRYDNLFLQSVAGGNHNTAKNKVMSVINLARPIFKWSSLGTKFTLEIVDIEHIDTQVILTMENYGKTQ